MFKFHQYQGPAVKRTTQPSTTPPQLPPRHAAEGEGAKVGGGEVCGETPYNIMFEQQQMLLQWQLEFQQKNLSYIIKQQQLAQQNTSSDSLVNVPMTCATSSLIHNHSSSWPSVHSRVHTSAGGGADVKPLVLAEGCSTALTVRLEAMKVQFNIITVVLYYLLLLPLPNHTLVYIEK